MNMHRSKRENLRALENVPLEVTAQVSQQLPNKKRLETLKKRYEATFHHLRKKYKEEYEQWFENYKREKSQEFADWRDKVIKYRTEKRRVSLHNIKQHEDYMHHLGSEYNRLRRERNRRRLNLEATQSSYRVAQLRQLSKESAHFITEETVDAHIARQLDPMRVVRPTIFSDRYGINDEVGFYLWRSVMADYKFEIDQYNLDSTEEMERVSLERLKYKKLYRDPLYPNVAIGIDFEKLIDEIVLNDLYSSDNPIVKLPNDAEEIEAQHLASEKTSKGRLISILMRAKGMQEKKEDAKELSAKINKKLGLPEEPTLKDLKEKMDNISKILPEEEEDEPTLELKEMENLDEDEISVYKILEALMQKKEKK